MWGSLVSFNLPDNHHILRRDSPVHVVVVWLWYDHSTARSVCLGEAHEGGYSGHSSYWMKESDVKEIVIGDDSEEG